MARGFVEGEGISSRRIIRSIAAQFSVSSKSLLSGYDEPETLPYKTHQIVTKALASDTIYGVNFFIYLIYVKAFFL